MDKAPILYLPYQWLPPPEAPPQTSLPLHRIRHRHTRLLRIPLPRTLSPAKVISVIADGDEKTAKVVVPDYQLSLAIGKEGQNARLAARLTGFKIYAF